MLCEDIKNYDQHPLEEWHFCLRVFREEGDTHLGTAGQTRGRPCDLGLPCCLASSVTWRTELRCDFNAVLSFSCPFDADVEDAFKSDKDVRPLFRRKVRVISTDSYLKNFASGGPHVKDFQWQLERASPIISQR